MVANKSSSEKKSSEGASQQKESQSRQAPIQSDTRGVEGFILLLAGVIWLFQTVNVIKSIEWFPPLLLTLLGLGLLAHQKQ